MADISLFATGGGVRSSSGSVSVAPNSVTVSVSGNGLNSLTGYFIALSWTPSPDPVSGYNVYRSATPGAEVAPPLNGAVLISGTSYIDDTVPTAATFYYTITSVENGIESAFSAEVARAFTGSGRTTETGTAQKTATGNSLSSTVTAVGVSTTSTIDHTVQVSGSSVTSATYSVSVSTTASASVSVSGISLASAAGSVTVHTPVNVTVSASSVSASSSSGTTSVTTTASVTKLVAGNAATSSVQSASVSTTSPINQTVQVAGVALISSSGVASISEIVSALENTILSAVQSVSVFTTTSISATVLVSGTTLASSSGLASISDVVSLSEVVLSSSVQGVSISTTSSANQTVLVAGVSVTVLAEDVGTSTTADATESAVGISLTSAVQSATVVIPVDVTVLVSETSVSSSSNSVTTATTANNTHLATGSVASSSVNPVSISTTISNDATILPIFCLLNSATGNAGFFVINCTVNCSGVVIAASANTPSVTIQNGTGPFGAFKVLLEDLIRILMAVSRSVAAIPVTAQNADMIIKIQSDLQNSIVLLQQTAAIYPTSVTPFTATILGVARGLDAVSAALALTAGVVIRGQNVPYSLAQYRTLLYENYAALRELVVTSSEPNFSVH